jgi:Flp pilus assembly protein TadG
MILGTIEFGYYIYTYSELENATRRASEFASKTPPINPLNPNDTNDKCVQLAKADALSDVFLSNKTNITMTFSFPNNAREIGKQVQVSTSYPVTFLTPIGQRFFTSTTFQFTSRRTITSIDPPWGYKPDCSP